MKMNDFMVMVTLLYMFLQISQIMHWEFEILILYKVYLQKQIKAELCNISRILYT